MWKTTLILENWSTVIQHGFLGLLLKISKTSKRRLTILITFCRSTSVALLILSFAIFFVKFNPGKTKLKLLFGKKESSKGGIQTVNVTKKSKLLLGRFLLFSHKT